MQFTERSIVELIIRLPSHVRKHPRISFMLSQLIEQRKHRDSTVKTKHESPHQKGEDPLDCGEANCSGSLWIKSSKRVGPDDHGNRSGDGDLNGSVNDHGLGSENGNFMRSQLTLPNMLAGVTMTKADVEKALGSLPARNRHASHASRRNSEVECSSVATHSMMSRRPADVITAAAAALRTSHASVFDTQFSVLSTHQHLHRTQSPPLTETEESFGSGYLGPIVPPPLERPS